jgi:hypothetical protein
VAHLVPADTCESHHLSLHSAQEKTRAFEVAMAEVVQAWPQYLRELSQAKKT